MAKNHFPSGNELPPLAYGTFFPAPFIDTSFNPYEVLGDRWLYDAAMGDSKLLKALCHHEALQNLKAELGNPDEIEELDRDINAFRWRIADRDRLLGKEYH